MSSLLSSSNDALKCIFIQNSPEDLLALRRVHSKFYIFVTKMIFTLNTTVNYQKRLLQCWSFKPSFLKDNFGTSLIFNALGNPSFNPLERIPGLLVISSQRNIPMPIEKIVDSFQTAGVKSLIARSYMSILMKLIPRLPKDQLESFVKSVIKLSIDSANTEDNFQLMTDIVDILASQQKTFKLKTIIDECYNVEKKSKPRNIRRMGLYTFTDHVPLLTKDDLNVLVNCIIDGRADLYFDAKFCLEFLAPKLIKEQISSIFDPIVTEIANKRGREGLSGFNVLSSIVHSMTPEQISKTYDLIIYLLDSGSQSSIDVTLSPIDTLNALLPNLAPKQCMVLIQGIIKVRVGFYYERHMFILKELTSKITQDEMPNLMQGILSKTLNGNLLTRYDFNFLMWTNHLLTANDIEAIIFTLVKHLTSPTQDAPVGALGVLKKIASKLTPVQINSLLKDMNENLIREEFVVSRGAFYLISGLATRLTPEQITGFLRLVVERLWVLDDRINDLRITNALEAIESLEPMFNEKHMDFIFEVLFDYLPKVGGKFFSNAENFTLSILLKLASKITEQQCGRFLKYLIVNIDNKTQDFTLIANSLTILIPKLSNEDINYLLPRIVNKNSVALLKGIAPRLTSEQIETILLPLLDLTYVMAIGPLERLGVLSLLVPQLSEKQCSTVLNYLLIPVLNDESYEIRQEAMQIISDMMFQKKFGYKEIIEADIQLYPEATLLYHMAIWLNQLENK